MGIFLENTSFFTAGNRSWDTLHVVNVTLKGPAFRNASFGECMYFLAPRLAV